jgi:outer membrane protein
MPLKLPALPSKSLLALSLGAGSLLLAPQVFAFDLSSAARDALQYDAEFLSARQQAVADSTKSRQGVGLLLPSAAFNASRSRTELDVDGGTALPNRYGNSYGITLSQPIFRLDLYAQYQQQQERSKAGEASLAQARIDALLRVTQAYFDVLVAQDSLASANAEVRAIQEQLSAAKRNFEVGTATITDQQEAQARFDLASANQIKAQNDLDVRRFALNQVVGKPLPQTLPGLRQAVALKAPQPSEMSQWVQQARQVNLRVQIAQSAAEVARQEVTRTRAADHYPSVNLVARKSRTEPYRVGDEKADFAETDTLGIELSMPLFNGGTGIYRSKEVASLKLKSDFDLENARRNAEQFARTSYLGVVAGLSQVKAFEAAERSSQLALESNKLGYEVGVRINIDVLNAQQQLFATQTNLSKARYETLLNGLRLKAATGALSEKDIDEINGLLGR